MRETPLASITCGSSLVNFSPFSRLNITVSTHKASLPTRAIAQVSKMPKFFCDYCDVYLTHDSMSVRKAHNSGRNHLRNVVDYYQQIGHEKAQSVIDSITSSYAAEGQAHANPMLPQNQPGHGFPPPPFAFPGGIPPPPFPGMPGAPPGQFPQGLPPPPGGGRGMPPMPPFPGPNGMPVPPNGLPFPPPPGGFPFPPPGAPGGPGAAGGAPPPFPGMPGMPPPGQGFPPHGFAPPGAGAPGHEKR
ncbi:U1 small nuclear ribonucleoprotein C [Fusarium napiforme]|uniref:U1 small nuclear ribonucleoprotein C n=3 Tax=Fusarium fujikuroi species complex TaxID=171627 RepID=A0A8H5JPF4_9HYPO|nr:U1 small nuclear ribonucleoprotein C [Fusarium napiforme]